MILLKIIIVFLPRPIKRIIVIKFLKYEIHKTAKIGLSWIYPKKVVMKSNSEIGHFNIAIHLDLMILESYTSIARSNWFTGFPVKTNSKHFSHQTDRISSLKLGNHSAITKKHHLDCTNTITIGDFATIAGYSSQFLTHSINITLGIQDSKPIAIGDYCFVGTSSTILGGSSLPSYSVLGAKSMLNKAFSKSYYLYGGNPAKEIKEIQKDSGYFKRKIGFID